MRAKPKQILNPHRKPLQDPQQTRGITHTKPQHAAASGVPLDGDGSMSSPGGRSYYSEAKALKPIKEDEESMEQRAETQQSDLEDSHDDEGHGQFRHEAAAELQNTHNMHNK